MKQSAVEYFDLVNKFAVKNQGNTKKQQSAVEWLVNEANLLENNGWILPLIEQAIEIEKQQIFDAQVDILSEIIPKEEPKQLTDLEIAIKLEEIQREEPKQETIREVVKRYYEDNIDESNIPREHYEWEIQDLMIGFAYQWQQEQDKKCYHPLPYRLAKSDVNFECTLCGKFI
jgi:hypothetical protein